MKILFLLLPFFFGFNLYSQNKVGINTLNPQKTLHIDGAGDNPLVGAPSASQLANDVIIDEQGHLGVGTLPQYALDIKSSTAADGLKIQDGREGDTKIMMSSSDGSGSWQFVGSIPLVYGKMFSSTGVNIPINESSSGSSWIDTNCSITLPPGKWCVQVSMLLSVSGDLVGDHLWITSTFPDANYLGSTNISGIVYKAGKSFLKGFVIINNTQNVNKTYKYFAGFTEYTGSDKTSTTAQIANFGSTTSESSIFAIRLADNLN